MHDEDPHWKIKTLIESYKLEAKGLLEEKEALDSAMSESERQRHKSRLDLRISEFEKTASIIYSFIRSYNHFRPLGQYTEFTESDVLNAQLVQDEITAMLATEGIHVHHHATD